MPRSGMISLIRRLRQMTETTVGEYSIGGDSYWSDDHLQGFLDDSRTRKEGVALEMQPEYVSGSHLYTRYIMPRGMGGAVEGTAGGTAVFRVYDSTGATITTGWTFGEREMALTFTADQEGSARYWSGYQYDLQAAAREVWLRKAAHMHGAINFSADGHSFDREQLYRHCLDMAKIHGYGGRFKLATQQRTDLVGSEDSSGF